MQKAILKAMNLRSGFTKRSAKEMLFKIFVIYGTGNSLAG